MRTIKITDEMHESPHLKGYRKFIFWNDDENGKPIDKDWFRFCYEQMQEFDRKRLANSKITFLKPSAWFKFKRAKALIAKIHLLCTPKCRAVVFSDVH